MIIANIAFAEIKFKNDIIFVPHIIRGNDDGGIIAKFIDFFGLLVMEPDTRFLDGGPMRILCTGDTYNYIIPYKLDEFCRINDCTCKRKVHYYDRL